MSLGQIYAEWLSIVACPFAILGSWLSVYRTEHKRLWLGLFSVGSFLLLGYGLLVSSPGFIIMEAYFTWINLHGFYRTYKS